jgi:hypothetical protein
MYGPAARTYPGPREPGARAACEWCIAAAGGGNGAPLGQVGPARARDHCARDSILPRRSLAQPSLRLALVNLSTVRAPGGAPPVPASAITTRATSDESSRSSGCSGDGSGPVSGAGHPNDQDRGRGLSSRTRRARSGRRRGGRGLRRAARAVNASRREHDAELAVLGVDAAGAPLSSRRPRPTVRGFVASSRVLLELRGGGL